MGDSPSQPFVTRDEIVGVNPIRKTANYRVVIFEGSFTPSPHTAVRTSILAHPRYPPPWDLPGIYEHIRNKYFGQSRLFRSFFSITEVHHPVLRSFAKPCL